jgi:general nucleoside transport system permease protein
MTSETRKKIIDNLLIPVLAIISGLVVASLAVLTTDTNPLTAYGYLFKAAFSLNNFPRCNLFVTLQLATPLILTGLSAVVAFRSGLFSLGQEGQLMLGGIMAAWLGYVIHLPPIIHPIVAILAAMLVGGIYGWLPGVLKVKLGVNELISTMVLNNIATLFVTYLINFPLRADQSTTAHSPVIDETAKLASFAPGSKWGIGFVLAILAAVLVYVYLWKLTSGYEQRMAGQARLFALFGGIPSDQAAIRGMFISGVLAGLAGAIQVLGVHYRMLDGFSAGMGFDGLTAAILGQVHPVGVFIVAIFFAGVRQGAQVGLQFTTNIPRELGGGIIALMILFVAADKLFRGRIEWVIAWWERWRGPKAAAVEENV